MSRLTNKTANDFRLRIGVFWSRFRTGVGYIETRGEEGDGYGKSGLLGLAGCRIGNLGRWDGDVGRNSGSSGLSLDRVFRQWPVRSVDADREAFKARHC